MSGHALTPEEWERRLPVAYLRDLLAYDPQTGVIRYRDHPDNRDRAGFIPAGVQALDTSHGEGYRAGRVGPYRRRQNVLAHRVAWALHHGRWPRGMLDHVNRDRTDNRIANLRETDPYGNAQNGGPGRGALGVVGVYRDRRSGRFQARVIIDGLSYSGGTFGTVEEAAEAVQRLYRQHAPERAAQGPEAPEGGRPPGEPEKATSGPHIEGDR